MFEKINAFLNKIHTLTVAKNDNKQTPDYSKARMAAGDVIIGVLTEHFSVREGLLKFPKYAIKDPSIQASWHALCHYEADEDYRRRDIEYANQQLELLELIAFTFKDGKELPQNIIAAYEEYYDEALIAPDEGVGAIWNRLLRFINL